MSGPSLEVVTMPLDGSAPVVIGSAHRNGGGAILVRLWKPPESTLLVIREPLDSDGEGA